MGVRKAAKRSFLRRVTLVLVALLATSATVAVGLTSGDSRHPTTLNQTESQSAPVSGGTPDQKVGLSALPIARKPFCDALPRNAVEDALAGKVTKATQYGNGSKSQMAPGLADVSHEYSCTFDGAHGSQVRVWLFAQPVQTGTAQVMARQALSEPGCRPARAPTFGTPTAATVCQAGSAQGTSKPTVLTMRGLFGQSWLSCQLTAPGQVGLQTAEQRADDWCVQVATSLGARP